MPSLSSMTILFVLCILHSCNGRNLRVETNEVGHKKQLQYLNKANDLNTITEGSPKVDPSLMNKIEETEIGGTKVKHIEFNDDTKKRSNSEVVTEDMKDQRMLRSKNGLLHGHGSLGSVSFWVPRNNEGLDHHPEFNLDYSPPKTHPPIHN